MSREKRPSRSEPQQVQPPKNPGLGLGLRPKVVLDSVTDAVITVNAGGEIRGWSAQALRTLRWPAADVVGRPWIDVLVPASDRSSHEAFLTQLRENRRLGTLTDRWELSIMCGDGHAIPAELSVTAVVLGALTLYCVFVRDITERRNAEQASNTFEQLVSSSNDAIVIKAPDGTVMSWNPGAERLYGYSAAEIVGKSISLIVPSERAAEELTARERVCRGVLVETYETERSTARRRSWWWTTTRRCGTW